MITVRPVRFTDRVNEMAAFLTHLDQHEAIVGTSGRWVDLVGERGHVAVHAAAGSRVEAAQGRTDLSFVVPDADAAAAAFREAGLPGVVVWDEAYGRVVGVDDPHGVQLWFDEAQRDLYGYRSFAPAGGSQVSCCPVVFTPDVEEYVRFLECVGLRVEADHGDYVSLSAPQAGGVVGVHRDEAPGVALAFVSSGDLDALAGRLRERGEHATTEHEPGLGAKIVVTDPDGHRLEVHPA